MSVFTFLEKLLKAIARLFSKLPADTKAALNIGVLVVENLKAVIESGAVDILTALIPGAADDLVKEWLRAELPNILIKMRLVDAALGLTDPEAIAKAAVDTFRSVGAISDKDAHDLSIMAAMVAADGKLTWSDGVHLMEYYYQKKYKPEQVKQAA